LEDVQELTAFISTVAEHRLIRPLQEVLALRHELEDDLWEQLEAVDAALTENARAAAYHLCV
jgi:hypothetical protein